MLQLGKFRNVLLIVLCLAAGFSFSGDVLSYYPNQHSADSIQETFQAELFDSTNHIKRTDIQLIHPSRISFTEKKELSTGAFFRSIEAVLFKIAVIPSFAFAVTITNCRYQIPIRQVILNFIQNKDGKKRKTPFCICA